ncbi:ABC transporter, transmembrane region:ABC transporter:Peptidase C39, bacteriocin processing [hydrothermal vent metagenome]|uniref:ABC transporter, transmembrane region:ABC transporter:Peptidase C39, bacteriocin processing n=1 Tax=hydrothermal vent metagenome TaxID=652676 RepID=A0A1W1D4D5_9ZZZZ
MNEEYKDPILECLVILTKFYNRPFSAEALVAGLPIKKGQKTPKLFSFNQSEAKSNFFRASKRAGFHSKLVHYTLEDISPLLLPVILILKGDEKGEKACILTEISPDKKYAKIILPEMGDIENWVKIEDLKKEYLNFAFLVKPDFSYQERNKRILKHEKQHWFWGTLKYSISTYFDVIIASFLINIFVIATPIFTRNIYDRVIPNNAIDTMWVFVSGIIVIYIFDITLKFLRSYFLESAAKKSDIIMSSLIFEKVMNLKLSFKPTSVGSFANHLKDFDSIRSFFTSSSISAIVDLPFSILFLIMIYIIGGSLVFIPILNGIIIILYSFIVEKPMRQSIESTYEASAVKNAILIETLSSLETIKALGISGQSQWKWEEASGEVAKKGFRSKLLSNSIATFTGFMVQINTIAVIVAGVYAIAEKSLTMGGLIAISMLASRVLAPLSQIASLIANFQQTKTAYYTLNEIMNLDVEREEGKKFVQRSSLQGKIEFKNVSFIYPNTDKKVLDNVSFVINSGESVGIIGANGSGKTTIEKLILGLYEPTEGSILIDNIDIKQIDPADLRRNISYVPQDVVLFQGTLKENIILKKPNANDEEIIKVAHLSGLTHFVNAHPMGFDMPIGERGDGLSGGQKQSISIARAFINNSPILLLDEPTSSMDSINERHFIEMIKQYKINKTMILISHKNNLLPLTNRLILLSQGSIILDDTRENVLKQLNTSKRV